MFLASMARFSLPVCLLVFNLVSCKLISRQLSAAKCPAAFLSYFFFLDMLCFITNTDKYKDQNEQSKWAE